MHSYWVKWTLWIILKFYSLPLLLNKYVISFLWWGHIQSAAVQSPIYDINNICTFRYYWYIRMSRPCMTFLKYMSVDCFLSFPVSTDNQRNDSSFLCHDCHTSFSWYVMYVCSCSDISYSFNWLTHNRGYRGLLKWFQSWHIWRLFKFFYFFYFGMSMWGGTNLHVKYVFLDLFYSDYFAMYGPVYWEGNKIQVKFFTF